jgi:hypothetical protein
MLERNPSAFVKAAKSRYVKVPLDTKIGVWRSW